MGPDKKKLLHALPEKLTTILHPETAVKVVQVWKDFRELYSTISQPNLRQENAFSVFDLAKFWLKLYLSLSHQRTGYAPKNITPYMHILVYHVPEIIQQFGEIQIFTGQGLKKSMDVTRHLYMWKVN